MSCLGLLIYGKSPWLEVLAERLGPKYVPCSQPNSGITSIHNITFIRLDFLGCGNDLGSVCFGLLTCVGPDSFFFFLHPLT